MKFAPVTLFIGLALTALAAPAQAEINFDAPFLAREDSFGNHYLAVADFDGDGHLDAVASAPSQPYLLLLLGRGDGGFSSITQVPALIGSGAYVEAGDLNGDGFQDLVTANTGANISVLLGHGDGTFSPHVEYATASSGSSRHLEIHDLNSDGHGEVILLGTTSTGASIFPGRADGSLGARLDLPFAVGAVGDVNSDGKPDLITLESPGVAVRLGHGDFTFDPATPVENITTPSVVAQLRLEDINGDGKLDVVYLRQGVTPNLLGVCLGHGDGTFGAAVEFACSRGATRIAVGDFDGDGRGDVVAFDVDQAGYILERLGRPDGTLGPERTFATGDRPWGIEAEDLNGDGRADLVCASLYGAVCVSLAASDGSLGNLVAYPVGFGANSIEVGDLNGDGATDVLAVSPNASGTIAAIFGDGAGHLGAPHPQSVAFGAPNASALGDLDGDGRLDLVLAHGRNLDSSPDSTIAFLGGNGDGTFGSAVVIRSGVAPARVSIVNANGDGIPDLAIIGDPSACSVLLGHGDGTFAAPVVTSTGTAVVLAIADLDGDGIADLVAAVPDTAILMFGQGDGSFGAAIRIYSPYVSSAVIGDLNGDGRPDLVLGGEDSNVSVCLGAGARAFVPGAHYSYLSPLSAFALEDLDHDGALDLLLETSEYSMIVLAGRGDGTFSPLPMDFGLGSTVSDVKIADLDGDGGPEILSASYDLASIVLLRNRSPLGSTAVPVTRLPAPTSLIRATPNPAAGNRLSVSFALAGREPARLEVFDIAGRRVRSLDVTRFGPGLHQVDLAGGSRLEPGLYVLRLSQVRRQWTTRAIVVE